MSFNVYGINTKEEKKEVLEIKEEIKKYDSKEIIKDIDIILSNIDKDEYLTEYKKYLLKEKTLLLSKMIFMNDDKKSIKTKIIPAFFKLNMCLSYQFRANIQNRVNTILKDLLTTKERQEMFNNAAEYIYSEKVNNVFLEYVKGVGKDIKKVCNSPLDLSTLKIKKEIDFFEKNKKENTK
tara:strand:- start:7555 stop:8094 length:540 start_codon:yes stop_codon:yes gene_type:complete